MKKNTIIPPINLSRILKEADAMGISDELLVIDDLRKFPTVTDPKRLTCLMMGVCKKGVATFAVNGKQYELKENDAWILTEGQVLEDLKVSNDCEGIGFMISYMYLYEILKDVRNISTVFLLARRHPVFALQNDEVNSVYQYFGMVKERIANPQHKFRMDVIRLLMVTMMHDVAGAFYRVLHLGVQEGQSTRAENIFVNYLQLVEKNFIEQRRIGWYAEQLGITGKYLSETVRSVSHHTPNDWIDRYVTAEVCSLLQKSDMRINEIAEYMHFPNQSFLGKYFKENVGVNPSEYRRQAKTFEK